MFFHNVDCECIKHLIKGLEHVFVEKMIFLDNLKKKRKTILFSKLIKFYDLRSYDILINIVFDFFICVILIPKTLKVYIY